MLVSHDEDTKFVANATLDDRIGKNRQRERTPITRTPFAKLRIPLEEADCALELIEKSRRERVTAFSLVEQKSLAEVPFRGGMKEVGHFNRERRRSSAS